jgi:hypothetical protein
MPLRCLNGWSGSRFRAVIRCGNSRHDLGLLGFFGRYGIDRRSYSLGTLSLPALQKFKQGVENYAFFLRGSFAGYSGLISYVRNVPREIRSVTYPLLTPRNRLASPMLGAGPKIAIRRR